MRKKTSLIRFEHTVREKAEDKILGRGAQKKSRTVTGAALFDVAARWSVQSDSGVLAVFNGFEMAQLLSQSAKKEILAGAREITDGPYRIAFVSQGGPK